MRSGSIRVADCTPWQECLETVLLKCHIGFRGEAGAQQLLSPSGRPGRTLLLQEGRWCGLATSAADHAPRALVCLPIASRTDDLGIRRPRRLSPSSYGVKNWFSPPAAQAVLARNMGWWWPDAFLQDTTRVSWLVLISHAALTVVTSIERSVTP